MKADKQKIIKDESGMSSGAGVSDIKTEEVKKPEANKPKEVKLTKSKVGLSTGDGEEAGDFMGCSEMD
jgi:hypothetical protein